MRAVWNRDKCLGCGNPSRQSFVSTLLSRYCQNIIGGNGSILQTPYWFCSDKCLQRVLESQIDTRFHFHRTVYDDPDLPDDHIEEWVDNWNDRKQLAIHTAVADFAVRAVAEYGAWVD